MKFTLLLFLSITLLAGPSYGFFKDPKEETIMLQSRGTNFPAKLGDLRFQKEKHLIWAYMDELDEFGWKKESSLPIGRVADERSLEIVTKYMENPDYHLDNAKKLGFYIGGPLLVLGFYLGFYIWRRCKTAKQESEK